MAKKATEKEMRKIFTDAYIDMAMFPVNVYFTQDKEKFTAMCTWINVEVITDVAGRCVLSVHENGNNMIYIGWFNDDQSCLVHECVHAALYLVEVIGHKPSDGDELISYVTGYIFKCCMEKVNP